MQRRYTYVPADSLELMFTVFDYINVIINLPEKCPMLERGSSI